MKNNNLKISTVVDGLEIVSEIVKGRSSIYNHVNGRKEEFLAHTTIQAEGDIIQVCRDAFSLKELEVIREEAKYDIDNRFTSGKSLKGAKGIKPRVCTCREKMVVTETSYECPSCGKVIERKIKK